MVCEGCVVMMRHRNVRTLAYSGSGRMLPTPRGHWWGTPTLLLRTSVYPATVFSSTPPKKKEKLKLTLKNKTSGCVILMSLTDGLPSCRSVQLVVLFRHIPREVRSVQPHCYEERLPCCLLLCRHVGQGGDTMCSKLVVDKHVLRVFVFVPACQLRRSRGGGVTLHQYHARRRIKNVLRVCTQR